MGRKHCVALIVAILSVGEAARVTHLGGMEPSDAKAWQQPQKHVEELPTSLARVTEAKIRDNGLGEELQRTSVHTAETKVDTSAEGLKRGSVQITEATAHSNTSAEDLPLIPLQATRVTLQVDASVEVQQNPMQAAKVLPEPVQAASVLQEPVQVTKVLHSSAQVANIPHEPVHAAIVLQGTNSTGLIALSYDHTVEVVGACVEQPNGFVVGCTGGCSCGVFRQCYPKFQDKDGKRVDVGVCELAIWVLTATSLIIFASALSTVVGARMVLQQWADREAAVEVHLDGKTGRPDGQQPADLAIGNRDVQVQD